jgi:hypothetical protein
VGDVQRAERGDAEGGVPVRGEDARRSQDSKAEQGPEDQQRASQDQQDPFPEEVGERRRRHRRRRRRTFRRGFAAREKASSLKKPLIFVN